MEAVKEANVAAEPKKKRKAIFTKKFMSTTAATFSAMSFLSELFS